MQGYYKGLLQRATIKGYFNGLLQGFRVSDLVFGVYVYLTGDMNPKRVLGSYPGQGFIVPGYRAPAFGGSTLDPEAPTPLPVWS